MNAFLRVGFVAALLTGCGLFAAPQTVKVSSTRGLRLAVVDPLRSRDSVYAAFAKTLSTAVTAKCGEEITVQAKRVSADHAAFNLGTGVYDAVLVLGPLPRALMISDVMRMNATLGSGKNEKKAFLIFNTGDETLSKLLSASFTAAITDPKFLDALDGGLDPTNGPKLASASP